MIQNFHRVLSWDVHAKLCTSSPECFRNIMFYLKNERGGRQRFWAVGENMCFAGFVFACFVFANVFVSDGEPSRVCQAPVSMKALISASFEVHVCLSVYACPLQYRSLLHCFPKI